MSHHIKVNLGLVEMLKGGVIMDVVNVEQAKIAEKAGAVAVMALERVPVDIRQQGGIARMSDPKMIQEIMEAVTIPVMAKVRIGHFVEAQILETMGIDFIDESEVLTPADDQNYIYKHQFKIPFVCGCTNLGEALRRIAEGASLIRTKGEAGTGNIIQAVNQLRSIQQEIKLIKTLNTEELMQIAKKMVAPFDLVQYIHQKGHLPVANFSAGGIVTPADAAMMIQLGAESVFVGSGIFKSDNPQKRAESIVSAVTYYNDPVILAKVSADLGKAMIGYEN